ncbi:YbhB/YbcL family Raf kinase inhibitor-like protein [Enemella evansiae]|uniref:YbhB/YbcL family Raf kinase inhibitor-like protein n=1 Tax=Enemella evansiae TaxID=2016499 RepID=A0A255GJ81_9ACTN|nr:YbhB/YbcL family Raf kinase inhibitor-like protein [Enemella evansiae]OYN99116.1 hypothetical protein CGZ96_07670 [Enemella evansiae]OYO05206.1 hypothetical protein CGZ97_00100 [Enemella evansiae]OYO15885.1 hypothetical protein CGZ94_06100 [Enemella evansiae]PFG67353.1 hypothetical protein B0O41_2168 [Propionibacteriaceae bacterium ES.041]
MSQNDPFAGLPEVPRFELTSTDVTEGEQLPAAQLSGAFGVEGGLDRSPQLSWSGFPEETKSFLLTCYDPDAPTMSGFWHWAVYNLPADTTSVPTGAGSGEGLPSGAVTLPNDASMEGFLGAAPPPGHGSHRYYFVVQALDVDTVDGVESGDTPAKLNFMALEHVIGRAWLVPVFGR